jgi:hypothetical protein
MDLIQQVHTPCTNPVHRPDKEVEWIGCKKVENRVDRVREEVHFKPKENGQTTVLCCHNSFNVSLKREDTFDREILCGQLSKILIRRVPPPLTERGIRLNTTVEVFREADLIGTVGSPVLHEGLDVTGRIDPRFGPCASIRAVRMKMNMMIAH